mgnify:CR=1 FL=1
MKQLLTVVTCLLAMSGSAWAAANSLELNFNDDSAQARLGMIINQDAYGTSLFDIRGLFNDEDELNGWMTSFGFDFIGEPGNVPGLELGIVADVRVGESDRDDSDFGAVGIGGLARYFPPALGGFGFAGRIIYSPKIFSFLEAERMAEYSIRAGYVITPKIGVHVEYQNVEVEYDNILGDVDVDDEVRIGFEARF